MNTVIVDFDQLRLYGDKYPIPVGQSQFSKIKFLFSKGWDGFTKIAQFKQGDSLINVGVINDECIVPAELGVGTAQLRIRGTAGTDVIATANEISLTLVQGFESGGSPSVPPSPDLYDDLIKEIKEAEASSKGSAEEAAKSASSAAGSAEAAEKSAESAEEAKKTAEDAAKSASESAKSAEDFYESIATVEVSAETLSAESSATVTKEIKDNSLQLKFGIPQGPKGDPGKDGEPGAPGAGSEPFVITLEQDQSTGNIIADKTFEEINAAYEAREVMLLYVYGNILPLMGAEVYEGVFHLDFGYTMYGFQTLSTTRVRYARYSESDETWTKLDDYVQVMPKTGGQVNGPLYLHRDPYQPSEAATKQYVDNLVSGAWKQVAKVTLSGEQNELTIPLTDGYTKLRFRCEIVTATSDHFTQIQFCPNGLPYFPAAEINNTADTSRYFVGECELIPNCDMIKGWQSVSIYSRAMKLEEVLCLKSTDYPIADKITSLLIRANTGSKPIGAAGTVITVWGVEAEES